MDSRRNAFVPRGGLVRPLIVAGTLLCALLLTLAWVQPPAVHADGTIHRVPDDFATIQAAIDAAADGDEIRVVGGEYFERLVITRSLRLSGSWDAGYTEQDPESPTIVDAAQGGRALTIYAAGITPTIAISLVNFIHGDASELGGVITPTVPNAPAPSTATVRATAQRQPMTLDELHEALADLVSRGAFPGGSAALAAANARADGLLSAPRGEGADQIAARAGASEIDCGGGIYVRAAQLRLLNVRVLRNTASQVGAGAGGGLCAVDMPIAGLQIDDAVIAGNVASTGGNGFGGGLFFGADQPDTAALSLATVSFRDNVAALSGNGYGGGAFVSGTDGAQFNVVVFTQNTATANGRTGMGGGLFLDRSNNAVLETVGVQSNNASTSLTVPDPTVDWNTGMGGGIYVIDSPGVVLTSPVGDSNARSLLIANVAALKGLGRGGGIHVENSPHLRIERTSFFANYAALYPSGQGETVAGGAVHLLGSPDAYLTDNDFNQNMAGVFGLEDFKLLGGAINVEVSDRITLHRNRFVENACGTAANPLDANGGALDIGYSDSITVSDNVFSGNVANLSPTGGLAGALHVQGSNDLLIHHNIFEHNRAGTGAGIGGAVVMEMPGKSETVWPRGLNDTLNNRATISANVFRDNAAALDLSGDEALLGGALALNRTNGLLMTNNLFADNRARTGAALALLGWDITDYPPDVVRTAQIVNNTLVANSGESGVHLEMWQTPITLTNNIVVSHTVGIHVETGQTLGMTAAADYTVYNDNGANSEVTPDSTLIETNAITTPVAFANFWGGDYHLQPASSARDAGDPAGVPPAPPVDIEGTPRPFGPAVDIGAYEWHGPQVFLPLMMTPICPPLSYVGWAAGVVSVGDAVTGTVMHTEDGGATWQVQLSTPGIEYFGVKAVDPLNAWVTGSPGTILRTRDGGQSWELQALPAGVPATVEMGPITAVDGQHAWTSAINLKQAWYLMHTVDGAAWQLTPVDASLPITAAFQDMSAADAFHVYGAGTLVSGNDDREAGIVGFFDGQQWTRQGVGAFMNIYSSTHIALIGINALDAQHAWVVGGGETPVYQTADGGATWFANNQAYIIAGDTNTVVMADAAHGWAAGDHGGLLHTADGWAHFDVQSASPQTFASITALDRNTAWATTYAQNLLRTTEDGVNGDIVRTCDGGQTWERQTLPSYMEMITISFAGARR